MPNEISFETALKQLETIVEQLEKGDQSLEKSLELFTNGTMMVSVCKEKLQTAQCQIKELADIHEVPQ